MGTILPFPKTPQHRILSLCNQLNAKVETQWAAELVRDIEEGLIENAQALEQDRSKTLYAVQSDTDQTPAVVSLFIRVDPRQTTEGCFIRIQRTSLLGQKPLPDALDAEPGVLMDIMAAKINAWHSACHFSHKLCMADFFIASRAFKSLSADGAKVRGLDNSGPILTVVLERGNWRYAFQMDLRATLYRPLANQSQPA